MPLGIDPRCHGNQTWDKARDHVGSILDKKYNHLSRIFDGNNVGLYKSEQIDLGLIGGHAEVDFSRNGHKS